MAGHADEVLVPRVPVAGVVGPDVPVGQVAEVLCDDPAVIDDDVAAFGESLDIQQRAVAEPVLAVLCLATCGDADAVADSESNLRRPVRLELLGQLGRRPDALPNDQA